MSRQPESALPRKPSGDVPAPSPSPLAKGMTLCGRASGCLAGARNGLRRQWQRGLCGRRRQNAAAEQAQPAREDVPVVLHVYDMGGDAVAQHLNQVFRPVGVGAYHGAIEVYGREWSFGWSDEGTGVFSCLPRHCPLHSYRETIRVGFTRMTKREVLSILRQLEWPGSDYDLLRRNCCHWCAEFARRLGADPLPPWLNSLADEVAKIDDGVRDVATNAQLVVEAARRRGIEVQEKAVELRENFEAAIKAKNDELREQVEVAWREWQSRAEELDMKLGLSDSLKGFQLAIGTWRQRQAASGSTDDEGDGSKLMDLRADVMPFRAFSSERVCTPSIASSARHRPSRKTAL
eukprot:CAMPEP_0176144568 /NCGR_PEP_ID=MMETSP0120_2-20121206/73613_1 /TAXON_ID=160619 /ORGANISM="Kryptoperidinium foliaceum, Strain CCMP 1326" /LENGTH=347 /DNA_ID=CAMNT_0017480959 /DNA_START=59 /DNA_END=1099 /DNA_ORIENTATION=+